MHSTLLRSRLFPFFALVLATLPSLTAGQLSTTFYDFESDAISYVQEEDWQLAIDSGSRFTTAAGAGLIFEFTGAIE